MNTNKIMNEIEKLDIQEIKKIKKFIDVLLFSKEEQKQPVTDYFLFYKLFKEYYSKEFKAPLSKMEKDGSALLGLKKRNQQLYKQITKTVDFLNEFLKNILETTPKLEEKKEFYILYFDLTFDYLSKLNRLTGLAPVLNLTDYFPTLLDFAFPDYTKAGILSRIIIRGEDEK